ncbi:MAG: AI-2E family transporter [Streptococcaceae bacterium]|nr:AI-2E family transporter [Streptococcaceae bacterium]
MFFWTVEILAVAALLFLLVKIDWVFNPITTLFSAIFIPFIVAGFLYYVFDPLLDLLEKKLKFKRGIGILLCIITVIGVYVLIAALIIPNLVTQVSALYQTTVNLYPQFIDWVHKITDSPQFMEISKQLDLSNALKSLNSSYQDILQNLARGMTSSIGSVVGTIVSIALTLFLIPILLYYMLKDGDKILPFVKKNILLTDNYNIIGLIETMNKTISKYIFGLAMDALFVFVLALIGYLIIGIPYAFLFALFAAVTNLIPYIGPYIGVVPVVLTVAFDHPILAAIAVVYVLVVQQIDGNVVYPKIVGQAIHVHPVTVMVLMMVSGSLYGLMGMVIAVPAYAMVKEIVKFLVALYRNIKTEQKKKLETPQL